MKAFSLLVLFMGLPCLGDIVQLNDGSKIEGSIKRETGGWTITDAAGAVRHVTDGQVKSIEKGNSLSPAEQATLRLTSLRKSLDNLSDIPTIIDRLTRFIDQNKETPAAKEAEKDVVLWKDRLQKKLVKIGGQWVTPEEQAAMMGKVVGFVDEARDLVKQGRLREADAAVAKLLALDSNNVSGLYLKGVLAVRQDQIGEARKSFDKVRDLLPDHAPTLNNLAVILFKQHQVQGSVALLDQAMVAAPKSRTILDNMAEARNALNPSELGTLTVKRALQHFEEQDKDLAASLKEQGLFRWGSSWVNKEQMDEVKKAQDKIKDKLDALAGEYEKVESRIGAIEDTIKANKRELDRIASDRWVTDSRGVSVQLPLPSAYYTLKRDNDRLESEETALIGKLDELKARALRIQQEMPFPKYTGALKMIDVEGTPLVLPAAAPKGAAKPAPAR